MISPKLINDLSLEVEQIRGLCRTSIIDKKDNYINIMSLCVDMKRTIKLIHNNLYRDDFKKPFVRNHKKI